MITEFFNYLVGQTGASIVTEYENYEVVEKGKDRKTSGRARTQGLLKGIGVSSLEGDMEWVEERAGVDGVEVRVLTQNGERMGVLALINDRRHSLFGWFDQIFKSNIGLTLGARFGHTDISLQSGIDGDKQKLVTGVINLGEGDQGVRLIGINNSDAGNFRINF